MILFKGILWFNMGEESKIGMMGQPTKVNGVMANNMGMVLDT